MIASDVITLAASRQDGARAAAAFWADGRINSETFHEVDAGDARDWGEEGFCLEDASTCAWCATGCEEFSRHRQMLGLDWHESHCEAFHAGFIAVALEVIGENRIPLPPDS